MIVVVGGAAGVAGSAGGTSRGMGVVQAVIKAAALALINSLALALKRCSAAGIRFWPILCLCLCFVVSLVPQHILPKLFW